MPGIFSKVYVVSVSSLAEFAQQITRVATSTFVYLKTWLISG